MRNYEAIKPTVYVETTVVSYLTSRPSNNVVISSRQDATRQLWNEHFDSFEFIVSDIVITEIKEGDENKRQHINRICRDAGYQPTTICTPTDLIEEMQMKEKLDPPTDSILEECYRIKDELNAKFSSMQEFSAYLKKVNAEEKARGRKYIPAPPPPDFYKNIEKMRKELGLGKEPEEDISDE